MVESALVAGFTSVGMDVFPVRTAADAGRRHADALAARRSRRDDFRLAQSLHRQRHQAVRAGRAEALRRLRTEDRSRHGQEFPTKSRCQRPRSAAPSASTMPRPVTSNSSNTPFRAISSSMVCASVVDCAHGAATRWRPSVLWELGADIVTLGVDPNGMNTNFRMRLHGARSHAPQGGRGARRFRHRARRRRRPRSGWPMNAVAPSTATRSWP